MMDKIEKVGKSLIQHGKYNDRIYLMKLHQQDMHMMASFMETLAAKNDYSKLFAKVPEQAVPVFTARGYDVEAHIPRFYHGQKDVFFVSRFLHKERKQAQNMERIKDVLRVAGDKAKGWRPPDVPEGYTLRRTYSEDIPDMVGIYRKVFATYPFPIHDPGYIKQTMLEHVWYYGAWHNSELRALSSAEMDIAGSNVEMTDFATLPEHRGDSLAVHLLAVMEQHMRQQGMHTAYTIARAVSYGMNITFARMGYTYSGTLVNNTNISGGFESMNIWYKHLNM